MSTMARRESLKRLRLALILTGAIAAGTAWGESLSGVALVTALRQGGYVLVMRHAHSPRTPPAAGNAERDNAKSERQLDEAGRSAAQAMGTAIKALRVPVGEVWSSPTYRALETIRLARLPDPEIAAELGDNGQSMQGASGIQSAWLRTKVAALPRAGTNAIIVTHLPNIMGAFGQSASALADGEALVVHTDDAGKEEVVGTVKIEEWPVLSAQQ